MYAACKHILDSLENLYCCMHHFIGDGLKYQLCRDICMYLHKHFAGLYGKKAKNPIKKKDENILTSGLRVCRVINLIVNLSFVSEQRITRSTTIVSPSGPL